MNRPTPHFCDIVNDKLHLIRSRKKIFLKEIVMFRGQINYTSIHLLSEYAFIRTHRAYLVNEIHLREYDETNSCMKMSNDMTVPVSRRRKDVIEQHIA
jgi:DNA-binding LytR/AlgR family response regulator